MSANVEQVLVQKIHALPYQKQTRVLEFVERLEQETDGAAMVAEESAEQARRAGLMRFVGIDSSESGNVSERVDEILAEGINKREGWSLP